jgi:hypothetical protein
MKFQAFLLEMAESEIMAMIPTSEYMRIKAEDPKPVFRAYVVGHEGDSKGKIAVAGEKMGSVVKRWYQSAIRKLHDKINIGLKFFHGHADTNALDGRVSIGQVVGKALKNIQDRLSVVVAAYVKPEFRNLPLDIASIEANVFLNEGDGIYEADVESVSAIALGSSQTETPGFANATLLGQIQAFAEKSQISKINYQGGIVEITINDIRKFIEAEKVKPSDIFSLGDLTGDPSVKGFVESETKTAVAGEYAHRKRTDEEFDKAREAWEKEKTDLHAKLKEKDVTIAKAGVNSLFDKVKEKRGLDERETKFIEKKLADFKPEDIEKMESEFDKFVDDRIDEFTTIRKDVFGEDVGEGDNKAGAGEGDGKKESITSPRKGDPNAKSPFDTNPLIPD